jgi:quercetin dioxygenase-like cupin family protein
MTPTETIKVGQLQIKYLVDGKTTGGMGVFEMTIPPDSQVPPAHKHSNNDECVYVLEGTLRYSVDGVTRDLGPGEWMFSPKNSVHQFSNPTATTARCLTVLTPDIGPGYFREVGAVLGDAGTPPDRMRLRSIMASYGLIPMRPNP